ncbi:MAG: metallophosphoesterase family protein [Bryobacteraceae bacterium]
MRKGLWKLVLAALAFLMLGAGMPAPQAPDNDFHFSILGDRTGSAAPEIYGRIWREIDLLGPAFVINLGDTIQGGRDEGAEADWQQVLPTLERYRRYPLFLVPGNHDIWSEHSRKLFEKYADRKPPYSFDYQNAHFVVLDNSQGTVLSDDQHEFLEKDLRAHRNRRPKFVFLHKPYWLAPLRLGSGEFRLHQLARQYGVDYVISGHTHNFARVERDGVTYIVVGSSGASLARYLSDPANFSRGFFYHHVWVWVKGSEARFTIKELSAPGHLGRMFRAEDWGPDGPQFDPADPAAKERPGT